jgi:GTP-sensing pleiotropic transcriptional regulator CodY
MACDLLEVLLKQVLEVDLLLNKSNNSSKLFSNLIVPISGSKPELFTLVLFCPTRSLTPSFEILKHLKITFYRVKLKNIKKNHLYI